MLKFKPLSFKRMESGRVYSSENAKATKGRSSKQQKHENKANTEWTVNLDQSGRNRTPKVIFLWRILLLAVFQGRISQFLTKTEQHERAAVPSAIRVQIKWHVYTLECRTKGRSQTLFAGVWRTWATSSLCSSGHTVSSINIHHAQSTSNSSSPNLRCKCKAAPPSSTAAAVLADRG